MLIYWEESVTTKRVPIRVEPLPRGVFGTQAVSFPVYDGHDVHGGHDGKTSPAVSVSNLGGRSSLRACEQKAPPRGRRDFCHRPPDLP